MAIQVTREITHKVPPHNLEAEQSVLGGILLEKDSITKVIELLSPEDFYHGAHSKLFRGMVKLFERSTPIDAVTLSDLFKGTDELSSVGGIPYIIELVDTTPTAANIMYYARIVKSKSIIRRIIGAATDIATSGYEGVENADDFIDQAEQKIFQIAQDRAKKSFFALKDIIKDAFETIEKLYERKSHVTGIATGFREIDKLTAGLQDSDLIIIAGRPGMGKTSFALNVAENAAIDAASPVAVFSLEMSKEQLVQRMLASRARIDLQKLRNGFLKDEDWGKLTTAVGTLYEAPIFIDDTPAQTVLEMRAKARRWKEEFGIKLVVIDYLQLMRGKQGKDNREQEISDISRSLKAMAKELHVPIVALSQLSRRAEQREGNIPQLSDLRESGAIEQDADVVMFVYREGVYKKCECPADLCTCGIRKSAEIIIAKQRNGPTGAARLTFMNEYTRFEDQAPHDYDTQGEWVE
ncbi:MAG TPA: replicative DNA helicase [Deltaproteobacteria bacterium]|nr:MAG: replicative DNA helicase [Deltaproteobacteria bacterium GWA2_55_82]OGQ62276.1 MAG: replicative DNA helicase [Deltaproteobacteria bacterium RIFCSPLOWO2_02_FULL_55_12]OIJ74388.1 MAG: replicative DNA helicase [Deltaproteobacteria bacterium GWC2_55_46]HBG47037.1 replicative DNA helicase [Deltaproteobacteria bacterium]HCY10903.1 replicative DNA helicase [Deltaproteobacteria bacterium]